MKSSTFVSNTEKYGTKEKWNLKTYFTRYKLTLHEPAYLIFLIVFS